MRISLLYIFFTLIAWSNIDILLKKKIDNEWHINYAISSKQNISKTILTYNQMEINHTNISSPNLKLPTTAIFLIDSSKPMKRAFIKGIKPTIKEIFKLKNSWDRWAIASFDSDIIIGEYNETTPNNRLDNISIRGNRTELYRASIEAINSLKNQDIKRKFLFIFSDGEAEDNAYTYQEVINKAKESNITIISYGYKDTIHLQSLRRISNQTGGRLYIANRYSHKLEANPIDDLNTTLQNNHLLIFNAQQLKDNPEGKVGIKIDLYLDNNSSLSKILIVPVAQITLPNIEEPKKQNSMLYYAIGMILAVILILSLLFKNSMKQEDIAEDIAEDIEEDIEIIAKPKAIAYLLSISGHKDYIYKSQNSIGALENNEVVIHGEYISRHHAIINHKDNLFYIIDTNSSNGVSVNYNKIDNQEIQDGDTISFASYDVIFKIL